MVWMAGVVGDPNVGKTSLMVRYVEGRFDEEYVETLGVNFMEKTLPVPQAEIIMSIWDLGGSKDFLDMLPMVCVDAVAVLFLFDLSNPSSLSSVREWYRQVRLLNKSALPFLVGCKFDVFYEMDASQQEAITKQARKFARAMKAPLILNSSKEVINVQKIFKLVFCQVFNVTPTIPEVTEPGMPIIEYKSAMAARASSASSAASSSGPGGDDDGEGGGRG